MTMMKAFKMVLIPALMFLPEACMSVQDEITFAQVDPLSKILRESSYFPGFDRVLDYAAGESATFQFVLRSGLPMSDLKISVSGMPGASVGFEKYVFQAHKTPSRASDALVPPSGYFPDPIIETDAFGEPVGRDQSQPMWVTVKISEDAAPGLHEGVFKVTGKCAGRPFSFSRSIAYNVFPVVLEEPGLWMANWFDVNPDHLAVLNDGVPMDPDSDRYYDAVRQLADKLHYCHNNAVRLSPLDLVDISLDGDRYVFDYTRFDRLARIFREAGAMKMLQGSQLGGREGLWESQFALRVPVFENGTRTMKMFRLETPEAQNFYRQFLPDLAAHIKEADLADVYTQYLLDEPTSYNIGTYVAIANFVKSLVPDIRLCEACHSHDLDGILDIWVPQLNYYKEGYDFYRERQDKGDQVWFYTCLAPQGEYLNRFYEQPLIKVRLMHWLNYRYGATGYLHWGFNRWLDGSDPFEETTRLNTEGGNTLPGGDCYIVYPYRGRLHGSIRLEAMRDGVADYTLLKMLEKKHPGEAEELCRRTVYGWTTFDLSTRHLYDTRTEILKLLSE